MPFVLVAIFFLFLLLPEERWRFDLRARCDAPNAQLSPPRLAIAGFLLLILGYAPYLVSPSHLAISQRTFLCATPGAVIVWIAVLVSVSRYSKLAANLTVTAMFVFGLGAQIFQFGHYVRIAETQRTILRNIVENFDGNLDGKTLLLLDESNQLNHTWMFLIPNLQGALSYIYGLPLNSIEVCHMPGGEWQHADALGRMGACIESDGNWAFHYAEEVSGPGYVSAPVPNDIKIPKDHVVTIKISPDGSIFPDPTLDAYRNRLFVANSEVARRYRGVLAKRSWPFINIFTRQHIQDQYRWDFGDWWSLELPTRGSGWREAEWEVNSFFHQASAWKSQERSTLYFNISPTKNRYVLRGRFDYIINESIKRSIELGINQRTLPFHWGIDGFFETDIPPGTLVPGINIVRINSAVDPGFYGLSAKLDWFEVTGTQ